MSQRKFRPKIGSGRPHPPLQSPMSFPTSTSYGARKRASEIWALNRSTCSNFTSGPTPGSTPRSGVVPSKIFAPAERSVTSGFQSASTIRILRLRLSRPSFFQAVQVIYNIFDQTPEEKLFPLCAEKKIGVLARVPLDEGGLTGHDHRKHPLRTGRIPRILFPGRPQETGRRTCRRLEERPGRGAGEPC